MADPKDEAERVARLVVALLFGVDVPPNYNAASAEAVAELLRKEYPYPTPADYLIAEGAQMTKYKLTVHIEVYASGPLQGAHDAAARLPAVMHYIEAIPKQVFETMPLPTGGITGAPHTEDALGWLGVYSFEEKE